MALIVSVLINSPTLTKRKQATASKRLWRPNCGSGHRVGKRGPASRRRSSSPRLEMVRRRKRGFDVSTHFMIDGNS